MDEIVIGCPEGYTLVTAPSEQLVTYTLRFQSEVTEGGGGINTQPVLQDILTGPAVPPGAFPPAYNQISTPVGTTVSVESLLSTSAANILVFINYSPFVIRDDGFDGGSGLPPFEASEVVFGPDTFLDIQSVVAGEARNETYTVPVVVPTGVAYCAPGDVEPEPEPVRRVVTMRVQELRFYNSYKRIPPGATVLPPQTGGPSPI